MFQFNMSSRLAKGSKIQGKKKCHLSVNEWNLVFGDYESELQCLKHLCQQTPKKSGARGWVAFFSVEASQIKKSLIHKFGLDWVKAGPKQLNLGFGLHKWGKFLNSFFFVVPRV